MNKLTVELVIALILAMCIPGYATEISTAGENTESVEMVQGEPVIVDIDISDHISTENEVVQGDPVRINIDIADYFSKRYFGSDNISVGADNLLAGSTTVYVSDDFFMEI